MDAPRFDALARSLSTTGSRRRALAAAVSGALGVLGRSAPDEATAAKSGKCQRTPGECERCKKGTCDRKNGKKTCRKGKLTPKAEGTPCASGSCQSGRCVTASGALVGSPGPAGPPGPPGPPLSPPPVCPAVCPTCQSCHPAVGVCAVNPSANGEAGTGCAAPKVCCGGTCCDTPVQRCTDAGTCATCADVCAANCDFCYHLVEGRTICGDGGSTSAQQCSSSASCPVGREHCVLSLTFRSDPTVTVPACSGVPGGAGCCYAIPACT
jgi:hypothetical protein